MPEKVPYLGGVQRRGRVREEFRKEGRSSELR
jgi:hypothetical protein